MGLFFLILLTIILVSAAFLLPHHKPKLKHKFSVASNDESINKDSMSSLTDKIDKITNLINIQCIQYAELKEEIKNMKNETKEELKKLGTKVENIVKKYGDKWEQASDTYEIMARTQIRKRFPTAKVVSCQSLHQLAEICLPNDYDFESDQEFTDKKKIGALPIAAVENRVCLLVKIARKQIPVLRSWMVSAEEKLAKNVAGDNSGKKQLERKVNMLRKELQAYDLCNRKTQYLRTSRLGFFAYSSLLITDQEVSGFIEELEVDFLRLPILVIDKITHFAGEVKFGKGAQLEAMVQALRRIGVFYMAGKHVLGKKHKKYTFEDMDR